MLLLDVAFYLVETLFGREVADETARYIEYRTRPLTRLKPPVARPHADPLPEGSGG